MPLTFEQTDFAPTPSQLEEIYASGFRGTRPDYEAANACKQLPRIYEFADEGIGEGQASLPYLACLHLDPEFGSCEAQTTGDCVSHSTRNAGMVDYCVDAMFGETKYEGRLSTEPIYGYRGHGGQGASCSRLALYVGPDGPGGFLPRKRYDAVDLSVYNSRIGHNWGRGGTPRAVNELADDNKALRIFGIRSVQEARDTIACGFGISRCGSRGYANKRDENGVSGVRGGWSHAMAIIGVDDTDWAHQNYGGMLFLVQNSWGMWNGGPKRHEQPDGSFWIRESIFAAEIRSGGIYGVASIQGFDRERMMDRRSDFCSKLKG